jgi:hypothetical protein
LQSNDDEIHVLPALPSRWKDGAFREKELILRYHEVITGVYLSEHEMYTYEVIRHLEE